jgi:glycosyltransferase involved in cell wall biosynthesis
MKIPCSVSTLTLNAGEHLAECLESLRDFDEVIVGDANSTDNTRDIARSFGARVVKQYDTDEPAVPCIMDRGPVRQRVIDASTLPWRLFIDGDDTLSPEMIEEIRAIVTDPNPKHLIWRMPSRVLIDGKEIKHYASYPAYQMRLVHVSVGARLRGQVHDRYVYDEKKFPVGTMQSAYTFHWPKERVEHFWEYQKKYARCELATSEFSTLWNFLRWGLYFRLRIISGYLLWRLPAMYLRYGFRDSMPLSLELQIVGYHGFLLVGSIGKYILTRRWWILTSCLLQGDTFTEAQQAFKARALEAYGKTLLIGEPRERARVLSYVKKTRWHRVVEATSNEVLTRGLQEKDFDTVIRCADIQ